jgi:hypothetical protein
VDRGQVDVVFEGGLAGGGGGEDSAGGASYSGRRFGTRRFGGTGDAGDPLVDLAEDRANGDDVSFLDKKGRDASCDRARDFAIGFVGGDVD